MTTQGPHGARNNNNDKSSVIPAACLLQSAGERQAAVSVYLMTVGLCGYGVGVGSVGLVTITSLMFPFHLGRKQTE